MITLLASVALLSAKQASAQDYKFGIGATLGEQIGLDAKYFLTPKSAINGTLGYGFSHNTVMLSVVYQYHIPIIDNLKFYFGGGISLGGMHLGKHNNGEFAFGLDPNVGIEYKIKKAPVALALDYRPAINLNDVHSQWNIAGIKVRYTF